jgi:hypothetical protein
MATESECKNYCFVNSDLRHFGQQKGWQQLLSWKATILLISSWASFLCYIWWSMSGDNEEHFLLRCEAVQNGTNSPVF